MSDWTWVALGYLVAYGGITGYAISLHRRTTRARRRESELEHPGESDPPGPGRPAALDRREAGLG